jgi:predicted transcriptional regulator of viral defense system
VCIQPKSNVEFALARIDFTGIRRSIYTPPYPCFVKSISQISGSVDKNVTLLHYVYIHSAGNINMRRMTRFQIAKTDIISSFQELENNLLTEYEISTILYRNRDFWRLPKGLSVKKFIDMLLESTKLQKHIFEFPNKKYTRYSWGPASIYKLALSLESDSFFSHYTAMYLNELTEQTPKTIYVNKEQPQKRFFDRELIQGNIDRAFKNNQRESNNIANYDNFKICKLNGKYTDKAGVVEKNVEESELVFVTNIERTLIDIAVRPSYSGGIYEVLNAYRNAEGKVSINKLAAMLKKIKYIYPYHQVIGFYLQRSGVYRESQIKLLKSFDFKYDFYLAHRMREVDYSNEWRLYYPKGF